ncbi:hypothetical protein O181_035356 [Austropuccinia psidii MF-1]|uniref:Integrase catalytic domain-containing protein n=1 Tax=Austropuccinia psidii MF-1 TaxID=1389203 RepID=A0A9Q3H8W2_9BASI|nr:hypothetical protein [Austropuccinia psidii MF-1]
MCRRIVLSTPLSHSRMHRQQFWMPSNSCKSIPDSLQKALQTDNSQEFTLVSFTNSLAVLGITFCPLLPYSPQENGEAERLNRNLGDMARAMVVQGQMPSCFWQYASASYIHNRIPNSRCLKSSPHQELFGQAPSIATLYPHGADAVVHRPAVHQCGQLKPGAVNCKLLRLLMSGGWLLWDQHTNKMVHSASVIFPQFQKSRQADTPAKGSHTHIINTMLLSKVPTEQYFEEENRAIASLPLVKDMKIPNHLGQALSGPHRDHWRTACLTELAQMAKRDMCDVMVKEPGMKTIGHQWVFDLKTNTNGSIVKFKARLVAHGDKQHPGVDCTETYAPTASLMSLCLMLATTVLNSWQVASFDMSGAYLYSPIDKCVLVEPPTYFMPELRSKVLSLKKALYGMQQGVGVPTLNVPPVDMTPFCSVISSLAYLVSRSRPDLAFKVNYLAHHSMGPTPANWDLLDHVVGYLHKPRDQVSSP